jgi:hypothetical protein
MRLFKEIGRGLIATIGGVKQAILLHGWHKNIP